ncbi:aerial mycelium formation protein [Vallicoccus soli]|uniref:RsiG family protein n=1 Tax=Vallicoccus soli TaxID=2339232 RepID=UPI000F43C787|nr:aerial mycelium formation protein [Vallicoccus soli]
MTDPMPGGRRRIDRVLGEGFLEGLADLPLQEVRERRREAEQEEADLSYVRRMLQGRSDILRAEIARRAGGSHVGGAGGDEELVRRLTEVLTDAPRGDQRQRSDHGLGRFLSVEPSRVDEHRREVEQVVADVGISDVTGASDEELRAALARVEDFEHRVSASRRRVQEAMDACTAEVARRYTEGQARVDDLLPER